MGDCEMFINYQSDTPCDFNCKAKGTKGKYRKCVTEWLWECRFNKRVVSAWLNFKTAKKDVKLIFYFVFALNAVQQLISFHYI
jgi:hypothetical protein